MGDFYIDLVFYNIKLHCYVLIDLKINQIKHQDAGQMDMYVRIAVYAYAGRDSA